MPAREMLIRCMEPLVDPCSSKYCLFRNVVVPWKVFNAIAGAGGLAGGTVDETDAPVLIWIHGVGYVSGSKASPENPATPIAASQDYSLSSYNNQQGWLAGDTNVTANTGLLDHYRVIWTIYFRTSNWQIINYRLLSQGLVIISTKVFFSNPAVQTQAGFISSVEQALLSTDASIIFHSMNILYPPLYNGTYGYISPIERLTLAISHFAITCNTYSLASTLHSQLLRRKT
ncbi:hypothetical protein EAF04_008132 [Stromatinia cepivora]|nr:hypothetical protein EAF04_008132 [Stromatinia cepivora]